MTTERPADAGAALDGRPVLVTGGSGFIGTNVVESLLGKTDRLLSLDLAEPKMTAHERVWRRLDIRDRDAVHREVAEFRPEVVLHLAARTDLHGRDVADYSANTDGVQNVADAVAAAGTAEVEVYASSRLVFDIHHRPVDDFDYHATTPYGQSKVEGERIVRALDADRPWVLVRPTSIWGPWFDVPYRNFFDAVLGGRYLHPAGRRIEKSYGYVGNAVYELERIVAAPLAETRGRVFWLADYPPLEVRRWANLIRGSANRPPVRDVPIPLLRTAAWAGDVGRRLGWREPPLTSFRLDNLLTQMVYDTAGLEHVAGPLPYSLEEGTELTMHWLRSNGGGA
jgi:GlcNAc-P-P-Und epimerase